MDGLDLALVEFRRDDQWHFELLEAKTQAFPEAVLAEIDRSFKGSAFQLALAHNNLGRSFGKSARAFLDEVGVEADLISSHGHTIFHRPDLNMTFQAGSGAEIAAMTGIDTVCDLRSTDVAFGGQGAPLVPLGEQALFPDHRAFLNLGGIANISLHGERLKAFDICLCNIMLDHLSMQAGHRFDKNGALAKSGTIDQDLLLAIRKTMTGGNGSPHTLGREHFSPLRDLLDASPIPIFNKLRTAVEAIALAIAASIPPGFSPTLMVTGGGAYNHFLIDRIGSLAPSEPYLPNSHLVEYKEAMVFAFLGLLRSKGINNCAASVTGALQDNIGGAIYLGNSPTSS